MVALRKLFTVGRGRRRRRAGVHAAGVQRVRPIDAGDHLNTARHAARKRTRRPRFSGASTAVLAMPRLFHLLHPVRPPELAGALVNPEVTRWQGFIRTTSTPAFGVALMSGLVLTWLGAAAPSYFESAHGPPTAEHKSLPHGRAPALGHREVHPKRLGRDALPKPTENAPAVTIDPTLLGNLQKAFEQIDQDAKREGWISHLPPVTPTCEPTCAHLAQTEQLPEFRNAPGPPQEFATLPAEPPSEPNTGPLPGPPR